MNTQYHVPTTTRIGHVHLKVANIDRSLDFYRDLLGFKVTQYYGNSAVFLSADQYHHHIALNTWQSKNEPPASKSSPGLYHFALLYPSREDLIRISTRLINENYPIENAYDHGVSEAIYLFDPDRNGVELYWDKPQDIWPMDEKGNLLMTTKEININEIINHNYID